MLVAMLLARSDEVAEMRRRDMLKAALGFTWIAVPNATVAQTRGRKRIGYLSGGSHGLRENNIDILEKHLGALGWRAGETREFEERWADGDFSRLPRLASELVMLRPDVIVATGSTETTFSAYRRQRNSRRIHLGAQSALPWRRREYRATGRKHHGPRPRTSNSLGQAPWTAD